MLPNFRIDRDPKRVLFSNARFPLEYAPTTPTPAHVKCLLVIGSVFEYSLKEALRPNSPDPIKFYSWTSPTELRFSSNRPSVKSYASSELFRTCIVHTMPYIVFNVS